MDSLKGSWFIRLGDVDAREMLKRLASDDKRSLGMEVSWLIREEFERRFGVGIFENRFEAQNQDISES